MSPTTYAVALTALVAATLFVIFEFLRGGTGAAATALSGAGDQVPPLLTHAAGAYGIAMAAIVLAFRRHVPPRQAAPDAYISALSSIREEQRDLARRYHEEKLKAEAASRSKTAFLAHLSHDIRTPLNAIIGFADMMRHETYGPVGDARYSAYVESIRTSGERLLGFFSSILDLAELESGRRTLNEGDVAVDELLLAVSRRFSAEAQRARLTLALGAPCGALLRGDRFSLERMLGNLVDNAIRFTPSGGRVKLAAHVGSDGVVLEITDSGIGIVHERLAALSQPFVFGDASLTKDREGAGLGLAIARTIVELSGGHLVIDSRPGLGTTVAVSLPLLSAVKLDAAA
ncbi:MAG: HAMP domain-containing sensor histidine kinase [Devosia sp.]